MTIEARQAILECPIGDPCPYGIMSHIKMRRHQSLWIESRCSRWREFGRQPRVRPRTCAGVVQQPPVLEAEGIEGAGRFSSGDGRHGAGTGQPWRLWRPFTPLGHFSSRTLIRGWWSVVIYVAGRHVLISPRARGMVERSAMILPALHRRQRPSHPSAIT